MTQELSKQALSKVSRQRARSSADTPNSTLWSDCAGSHSLLTAEVAVNIGVVAELNLAERFISAAEEKLWCRQAMMASNGAAYDHVWNRHPILDNRSQASIALL